LLETLERLARPGLPVRLERQETLAQQALLELRVQLAQLERQDRKAMLVQQVLKACKVFKVFKAMSDLLV
jgi:hypothetical protein